MALCHEGDEADLSTTTIRKEGDCHIVKISLGSVSEERSLSFVQFVVMCVGLIIVVPDFQLMRFQTGLELVFSITLFVFCLCWIAIGMFASSRCLVAPCPILLSFGPNEILYDSGRAALSYLCRAFEDQLGPIYWRAFERRMFSKINRNEVRKNQESVTVIDGRIRIQGIVQTFDLGLGIPLPLQSTVQNAIRAWIKAQPNDAPKSAVGCFEMERLP